MNSAPNLCLNGVEKDAFYPFQHPRHWGERFVRMTEEKAALPTAQVEATLASTIPAHQRLREYRHGKKEKTRLRDPASCRGAEFIQPNFRLFCHVCA